MSNGKPGTDVARRGGRGLDDLSVIGFVERHHGLNERAAELLAEAQAMASAAETQPVAAAVKANLDGVAAMARSIAGVTEGLYATARKHQADDYERAENPRGGTRAVEQKADVQAAGADGY